MKNPFSLKGKITGQISNNFTIIKSIIIILVYVSWLKKNLSCFFFPLIHILIIFFKGGNTLLFFFSSPCTALSWMSSFSLSGSLLAALSLFSCAASSFFALAYTLFVSFRRWQYLTLSFLLHSSGAKIPFFSLGIAPP